MSKAVVIKDREKRGWLWCWLLLSWFVTFICALQTPPIDSVLSRIMVMGILFGIIPASFIAPIVFASGRDKIKFQKGYMYCKYSRVKSKYCSFLGNVKIPIMEIKLIYLDKFAGLMDVYNSSSERIASVPCLGIFSSKKYLEDIKKYFEQENIEFFSLEDNEIKSETLLIKDQDVVKKYMRALGLSIAILCVCILFKSALLSCVCIVCIIILCFISFPISRIEIVNDYIICDPLGVCNSKYTSFFGKTKLPIKDINLVCFSNADSILSLNRYCLEFFDTDMNKMAEMQLGYFTSREFLIKIKNKFQSINICVGVKGVSLPEGIEDNNMETDTSFEENKNVVRRRKVKEKTENNKITSENKKTKQENKIGRYIDLS